MLTLLALAALVAAARVAYRALTAWRQCPKRNEDMVLF